MSLVAALVALHRESVVSHPKFFVPFPIKSKYDHLHWKFVYVFYYNAYSRSRCFAPVGLSYVNPDYFPNLAIDLFKQVLCAPDWRQIGRVCQELPASELLMSRFAFHVVNRIS
jgi:hypothetical protein